MSIKVCAVSLLQSALIISCLGGCDGENPSSPDSDVDSDGDSDTDADTDTDTDGDSDTDTDTGDTGEDTDTECDFVESEDEEYSPIQVAAAGLPDGAEALNWARPAEYIYLVDFSGTPGSPASHEGTDYVHGDDSVKNVEVLAAANGVVEYVRIGCPQSSEFSPNTLLRECGAGWGNHVVVNHGGEIRTRYAHLKPDEVTATFGQVVSRGDSLGLMGNSGRSELRHLHFELGAHSSNFDSCGMAQSFDYVHDSENLEF